MFHAFLFHACVTTALLPPVCSPQMEDHIDDYLKEQIEAIDEIAKYCAQLTRIGASGIGAFIFDKNFS